MIVVFCELGGSRLLGKAREIADATGDKLVALSFERSEEIQQNLIHLGADEVISFAAENVGDWVPVISEIVRSESNVKMVVFPSNLSANILMGLVYSNVKPEISSFLDGAQALDADSTSKRFEDSMLVLQRRLSSDKTALVSLEPTSFAEPFMDTSRYGKIKAVEKINPERAISLPVTTDSSSKLTVLAGRGIGEKTVVLAKLLAEKYHGEMKIISGKVEVIYGPCIAVEISAGSRELPEFKGELISVAEKNPPIGSIAEVSVVTPELDSVLEGLASD
jgi:electron transfer flavoprotein alpha subunit